MARGARGKLDKEKIKKASSIIANGNFAITAQQFLRISPQTWYNWMNWGEEQSLLDEDERDPKKRIYMEFFDSIKSAEAQAEITAVKNIRTAGLDPSRWQANAWYLERKHPERWGQRQGGEDQGDGARKIAEAIKNINVPDE